MTFQNSKGILDLKEGGNMVRITISFKKFRITIYIKK
nr:MAG TPA: hypothetical protein [Caudoviricetes sp.]DAQ64092.1 MAG TPA: hypothetical protein [Caudoviricetes sp.]